MKSKKNNFLLTCSVVITSIGLLIFFGFVLEDIYMNNL